MTSNSRLKIQSLPDAEGEQIVSAIERSFEAGSGGSSV
jgi:hypothetical protein